MEAADVRKAEDGAGEQAAERTGKWRHDDEEREAEGQLGAAVPARQVVGGAGHHARLEDAEDEAHAAGGRQVVHEGGPYRGDAEAERQQRDEPPGAYPLAGDGRGDLKDDVRHVEGREHRVVVVAFQVEVPL